jgi:hypothetical protein
MRKRLTNLKRMLTKAMETLDSFFHPSRHLAEQQQREKAIEQEQQEICELATRFDNLNLAGFNRILEMMAEKVNATIAEATEHKGDPAKQCVYVNRWDAQRELLDAAQAYVEDTRKRRDEINEQKRLQAEGPALPQINHTWDLMGQL